MHIELRNVTKRFGVTLALSSVSFAIPPGRILAVLGANGAGKTTLLRSLATVVSPDKGEILFDNERLDRGRLDLRRRLGFLPDFPTVYSNWSVVRFAGMVCRLYEADMDRAQNALVDLLSEFDLLALARRPMGTLSRGQTYKAALVSLLAADPELWLFDEPFASGMDSHGITAFRRHCRAGVARGRTVVFTTQLLQLAETFSDDACVIHRGKVHAHGPVAGLGDTTNGDGVLEGIFQQLREEEGDPS